MARKSPSEKTLRFIYAKSGNRCAFPDCNLPIYEDNGVLTGECCHIEAYSKGGARYNDTTTEEEKNAESNLIMMCSRHHKIVDTDSSTYTTEILKQMKSNHERKFSGTKRELDDKMLFALEQSMENYWRRLENIDNNDKTDLKIKIDSETDIQTLLGNIAESFKKLEDFLSFMAESDENLPRDLQALCAKAGVDYAVFENIPYWENSFINRLWEIHNLGVHNVSSHLKMYFLQLCVKVFAELSKSDSTYNTILQEYQEKLAALHNHNYYAD